MSKPADLFESRILATVALGVAVVLLHGPAAAHEVPIEEQRLPDRIVWETERGHSGATLRVVNADLEVVRRVYQPGEALVWTPSGSAGRPLPDGRYTYELRIREVATGTSARPVQLRRTGSITVRGGQLSRALGGSAEEGAGKPDRPQLATKETCDAFERLDYQQGEAMCAGEECFSNLDCIGLNSYHGNRSDFPLLVDDFEVGIHFSDASTGASVPRRSWMIQVNDRNGADEFFAVVDCGEDCYSEPDSSDPAEDPSESYSTPLFIEGGVDEDTIYLTGDNVGFGTVPGEDLHLLDSTPTLRLEDSDSDTFAQVRYNVGLLALEGNSEQNIVELSGAAPHQSIVVSAAGRVGLGTGSPTEDLHISSSTPTLVLEDSDTGKYGRIRYNVGLLAFEGNSGQNIVELDGQAPARAVVVDADGDVSLGAGMSTSSSREVKEAFEPVDHEALLDEIATLPITTWIYKRDTDRGRHLGPMAEDFHATFGLGEDGKHISPNDLAGVALVGVQGLRGALAETERVTDALREEKRALRDRVEMLEELTGRLVRRLEALEIRSGTER